jgi:hypothetical protein
MNIITMNYESIGTRTRDRGKCLYPPGLVRQHAGYKGIHRPYTYSIAVIIFLFYFFEEIFHFIFPASAALPTALLDRAGLAGKSW